MPAETASPFSKAAHDLIARGFHIVPIAPKTEGVDGYTLSGKAPGERRGASWRGIFDWQRFRDRKPSPLELEIWGEWAGVGIGIVLGSRCGDYQVVAVDIDAGDPDAVEEIRRVLPYSPMIKRGMKGMTLFYRADPALTTRQYKVGAHPNRTVLAEILTGNETRQTVVPPTIHPDTGRAYVWVAGGSGVKANDLPIIASEDVEALEETLHALGWRAEPIRFAPHSQIIGGPIDDDTPFARLNAEALTRLDAWVPALDLYSLRRARGGYECVATWRGSSTGRAITQRARNLSIQPNGIKDFGDDRRYSALDLVMAARGCGFDEAFAWLSDTVQGDANSADAETLKAPARVKAGVPAHDPETGEVIEADAVDARRPADAPDFPDELCFPRGLVGAISRWIVDTARRPQPALALAAAVTLVGTAMGRQYAGPTGVASHFYTLGLAPTGGGKDHPLQQAKKIMLASGMGQHLGPGQFISMTSVINVMERSPLVLCVMDEFASFLMRINDRRAGGFEKAVGGVLRTAWSSGFEPMPTPEWAQKRSSLIHAPALSLLGSSTPDEFYASLSGLDAVNGILNRFLIFPGRRVRAAKPTHAAGTVPPALSEGLKLIMQAQGALYASSLNSADMDPGANVIACGWADDAAEQAWADYVAEIDAKSETDAVYAAFHSRAAEYAQRLAFVHAVGRVAGRAAVDREDVKWGVAVARACSAYGYITAQDYIADTDSQARVQEIIRALKTRGGQMRHRELMRALNHRHSTRDIKDALVALSESGRIVAAEESNDRGRPTIWYRLGSNEP